MNSGIFYLQFFDNKVNQFTEPNQHFTFSRFFNPSGSIIPVSYIQVSMTGITGLGAGQTPFTGVTGYYTAIDLNPLPTNPNNYSYQTSMLSGIRFNCPVSFSQIEMNQINIGDSNFIAGYATGVNIGSRNSIFSNKGTGLFILTQLTGITGLGAGQTPFTGVTGQTFVQIGYDLIDRNLNFGFQNAISNVEEGYNFGASNTITSAVNILQMGLQLSTLESNNSTIVGRRNELFSGDNVLLFGNDNDVYVADQFGIFGVNNNAVGYDGSIVGHSNTLTIGNNSDANIFGNLNVIKDSSSLNVLGDSNVLSGIDSTIIVGTSNSTNSTGDSINSNLLIVGKNNTTLNSNEQILVGEGNSVENSSQNILFGKNISSFGNGNLSFGKENLMNGSSDSIYGKLNVIDSSSQGNFIVGSNNSLSGASSNTIIGSSNISNRDLLDSLYLQELTGITGLGAGQTPFTGITGYKIGGGYTGIEIVGGNSNFFVGDLNEGTLNTSTYVFGKNNQLLDNLNSHVIGNANYLEKSTDSYVLGKDNIVSGKNNYVIGFNNTVKEGDENSIFIGIGQEKQSGDIVTSLNLGIFDSKINIDSENISLESPNRPTYNNQNLLIPSDLSTYITEENGLKIDNIVNGYTFFDPSYSGLSNKIELSEFTCTLQDRFYTKFSGVRYNEVYDFQGYFAKKKLYQYSGHWYGIFVGPVNPPQYYPLVPTIVWPEYGNVTSGLERDFYESYDGKFSAVFSKILNSTGCWIITPNVFTAVAPQPLFYNPSINSGVFPLSGWRATGVPGMMTGFLSNYNPYVDTVSFTGNLTNSPQSSGLILQRNLTESNLESNFNIPVKNSSLDYYNLNFTNNSKWLLERGEDRWYLQEIDPYNFCYSTPSSPELTDNFMVWNDCFIETPVDITGKFESFAFINHKGLYKFNTETLKGRVPDQLQLFAKDQKNFDISSSKVYDSIDQGITVIYGRHKDNITGHTSWFVIDKYSSGIFWKNDNYTSEIVPQINWQVTGYLGYSGVLSAGLPTSKIAIDNINAKTGLISSFIHPTYGKLYIPFYY